MCYNFLRRFQFDSSYVYSSNVWQKRRHKKQVLSMEVWLGIYALISFIFVNKIYGIIVLFSILVYPILKMYDGSRGKLKWMKWLFYIYYPLHLAIIGLLRILMYGNVPLLF